MRAKQLEWAMREWLKCTTLDPRERDIVDQLLIAAQMGEETFEQTKVIVGQIFARELFSAISKARAQGIGKEWPADV